MMPLGLLNPGEQGEIIAVRTHGHKASCCGKCGGEQGKCNGCDCGSCTKK